MTLTLFGKPEWYFWKKVLRLLVGVGRLFSPRIHVREGGTRYTFRPKSRMEIFRYTTFFTKEEGTLKWLRDNTKEGTVFFDIGANIGLYSLYAAKAAKDVQVYSFEPHKLNFATLLENIFLNGLEKNINPLALALGDSSGLFHLNYNSMESGASLTQLGHTNLSEERTFTPKLSELVNSMSLDKLIESGEVPKPDMIKIDVDGNELPILRGMTDLLKSGSGPKSLQVEINQGQRNEVAGFMQACGYTIDHCHFTSSGQKLYKGEESYQTVPHNAVFVRT